MQRRVALVWGGSRGIGAATVRRLASDGFDLVFTSRGPSELTQMLTKDVEALGGQAVHVEADAAEPTSPRLAVDAALQRFGRLDVVVCSAGIFPFGELHEMSLPQIEEAIAIHVRAPYLLAQASVPHLKDGGRIISIGSTLAERAPYPGVSLYATTKAALIGLTRSLARELGSRQIAVNMIYPGNVDTDMNPADSDEAREQLPSIAMGRYGEPDDVASLVAYLASDAGAYISGAILNVDGGLEA